MITGNHLRRFRYLCNYKQEYVARKMNISVRTYRKIENEEIPLTTDRKNLALKALNASEIELLQLDEKVTSFLIAPPRSFTEKEGFEKLLYEQEALIRQKEEEIIFLKNALNRSFNL